VTEEPAPAGATADEPLRILVVCTGNSARSILGEALLRHLGEGRLDVRSAGTHPKGVNPDSLRALDEAGIPADGLESTSVMAYLGESFDYVITVCDSAREACPVFPGARQTLHWGLPDPAAVEGSDDERLAAFRATLAALEERARGFPPIAGRLAARGSVAPA
jgi:arsenate reductase (thioredoxin)